MASSIGADAPVKYESPYDSVASFPPQMPLKRRRSSENDDGGEKRQRIGLVGDTSNASHSHLSEPSQLPRSTSLHHDGQAVSGSGTASPRSARSLADPHLNMRIHSLPILESLSTQILTTLAQGPWEETIKIITEPEHERGQAYATMKSLLDQTKKIYTQQDIFLSAEGLNIDDAAQRETIRITNLATFVSGVFAGDVGFYDLNDHFVETFTSRSSPFSRDHGLLFLNLKTQVYLAALGQDDEDRSNEETLYEMFPGDLDTILAAQHPEFPLSKTENEFIEELNRRREFLKNESRDIDSIDKLSNMYSWQDFLRSLSEYLRRVYEAVLPPRTIPEPAPKSTNNGIQYSHQNGKVVKFFGIQGDAMEAERLEAEKRSEAEREIEKAFASYFGEGQKNFAPPQPALNGASTQTPNGYTQPQYAGQAIPQPPDQSAPTSVLYEKARQAAVAKTNPTTTKRPGLPSQRRPWSQEEENALMAGLDLVKGPHWSNILALYGPDGSVNTVLRERNQVQLKDKARNLKLFFLKSNIEVPHYLRAVTGELRTRAPSQAAKKEAEQRELLESAEEQERIGGIFALNSIKDREPAEDEGEEVGDEEEDRLIVETSPEKIDGLENEHTSADERLRQRLSAHNSEPTET